MDSQIGWYNDNKFLLFPLQDLLHEAVNPYKNEKDFKIIQKVINFDHFRDYELYESEYIESVRNEGVYRYRMTFQDIEDQIQIRLECYPK